jgi:hypothetical protein
MKTKIPRLPYLAVSGVTLSLALLVSACDEAETEKLPLPSGVVVATITPDTRQATDRADAERELKERNPSFADVIRSVKAQDINALLALVDWEIRGCGPGTSSDCAGRSDGMAPMIATGELFTVYATEEALRPHLELLLKGAPLRLDLAASLKAEAGTYYMAFDGEERKGRGLGGITDPDLDLTGLVLVLDAFSKSPIVRFQFSLHEAYPAEQWAHSLGIDRLDLITLQTDRRVGPEPTLPIAPDEEE